jgi:hypothetical protein
MGGREKPEGANGGLNPSVSDLFKSGKSRNTMVRSHLVRPIFALIVLLLASTIYLQALSTIYSLSSCTFDPTANLSYLFFNH